MISIKIALYGNQNDTNRISSSNEIDLKNDHKPTKLNAKKSEVLATSAVLAAYKADAIIK